MPSRDDRNLEVRLNEAENELLELARAVGGEELAEKLFCSCAKCEDVYAELGMLAGAALAMQLLHT